MKSEDLNVTWQQPVDPNLWQRPGLRLKLIEFLVKSFDSQGRIYGEPVAFGKNHLSPDKPRKAGPGFPVTDSGVLNPNNIVLPSWKVVLVVPCHQHAELR